MAGKFSDKLEKNINTTNVNSMFAVTDITRADDKTILNVDISKLHTFENHPFKVLDDDIKMIELIDSIREQGVIYPIIIRPKKDINNEFEIIAGHRRTRACEILGIKNIPAIVKKIDNYDSTILMVDSNIQREELLFSEKAFAYKMKLDAMKKQGKRTDLTSAQVGPKLGSQGNLTSAQVGPKSGSQEDLTSAQVGPKSESQENLTSAQVGPKSESQENLTSAQVGPKLGSQGNLTSIEILAKEIGESRNQIKRYIRLTYLTPELLDMTDRKKIPFTTAVELSYLLEKEQLLLLTKIKEFRKPTLTEAKELKKISGESSITEDIINSLFSENNVKNSNSKIKPLTNILKKKNLLNKYFTNEVEEDEIEKTFLDLLELYYQNKEYDKY